MANEELILPSLRWEHPEKKRYYRAVLTQDLLGDWVITKVWGGISQSAGRVTHIACTSFEEAKKLMENIAQTRSKRGYVIVLP